MGKFVIYTHDACQQLTFLTGNFTFSELSEALFFDNLCEVRDFIKYKLVKNNLLEELPDLFIGNISISCVEYIDN